MIKDKHTLYKDTINILDLIEISIEDKEKFTFIRKKMLDLANDILKIGDVNAE